LSRSSWSFVLLLCAAVVLRIVLALRPGIWGDEIFSLAMATGHSLEHPAAEARPELGDYVEPRPAVPSGTFRRYVEHENPPASPRRVVRAVALSDTNPPVYYLLLHAWTRLFGTSDAALHLFSVACALVAMSIIWRLGRDLGGAPVGRTAVLLFALSPVSLFYSVEGRMYSLLWVFATALAWTTLALGRRGFGPMLVLAWVGLGVGGLLTHYFFLFTWCGMLAWLAWVGAPQRRWAVVGTALLTVLAIAPWYSQVPASLGRWRVTGDWLAQPLAWPGALSVPISLGWRLLAGGGVWGGSELVDGLLALTFVVMAVYLARRGGLRPLFDRDRLLLWAWVLAAVLGVFVFDILRGTSASYLTRYALAGFPAAMLLVALAVQQLPARARSGFLVLMVLGWSAGAWPLLTRPARPGAAYGTLSQALQARLTPSDLVLVHSVPSGVIALSRYLAPKTTVASWVAPLAQRGVPDDLEGLLRGRHRVALVQVHHLSQPAPVEPWLRQHASLVYHEIYNGELNRMMMADTVTWTPAGLEALRKHQMTEIFYFEPETKGPFFSTR
jgi:4-amino-4-deoxy-L-arabinose transferase-like glycosyltransferase